MHLRRKRLCDAAVVRTRAWWHYPIGAPPTLLGHRCLVLTETYGEHLQLAAALKSPLRHYRTRWIDFELPPSRPSSKGTLAEDQVTV